MTELTASRTLVKSPPELWAECSDAAALSRHLDRFGEIRITRLEPETVVAWEGEAASGTVRLEPSGWGTRVVLTAQAPVEVAPPAGEPAPAEPAPAEPAPRRRALGRLLGLFRRRRAPVEPASEAEPVAEPEPDAVEEPDPGAADEQAPPTVDVELHALEQALDSLGQAHHRPFSRA